jgi:hypothetical protein
MRRRQCCECKGWFRKRDGSGWLLWTCHECRSRIAAEKRRGLTPPPEHSLPPAGWLRDPSDTNGERWWDGNDWTTHTR